MSRMVGTVSMGIRAPIIRSGDDLVEIVTNSVLETVKDGALTIRDRDVIAMTEAIVARALAALAKEPVPAEVSAAYEGQTFSYGQGYVIPKPFDPRLIEWLPPAVAQAAMDTGVARKPIEDMDAYKASLRVRIQKAQARANALIESYK